MSKVPLYQFGFSKRIILLLAMTLIGCTDLNPTIQEIKPVTPNSEKAVEIAPDIELTTEPTVGFTVIKVITPLQTFQASDGPLSEIDNHKLVAKGFNEAGELTERLTLSLPEAPKLSAYYSEFQITGSETSKIIDVKDLFSYDADSNSFSASRVQLLERLNQSAPQSRQFGFSASLIHDKTFLGGTHRFKFSVE